MSQSNFYSAVYVIIKNQKWEILFGRRKSRFKDWYFQIIPAGHLDWEESIVNCAVREAKEELNIDILPENIKVVNVTHRVAPDRVYFDIYVEALKYTWEITLNEPDKCSEIKFIDIDNLPKDDFVNYDVESLRKAQDWEFFSEIICK